MIATLPLPFEQPDRLLAHDAARLRNRRRRRTRMRFDFGASESQVTTGMPASIALLIVSVRKSPLSDEMAMPSTRCVMKDSRISFCFN